MKHDRDVRCCRPTEYCGQCGKHIPIPGDEDEECPGKPKEPMNITAALIKELRDRTQAPMGECKKALVATDGDVDAAVEYLTKHAIIKPRIATRVAAEGRVSAYVDNDLGVGVMLELNCESDFVANTPRFTEMAEAFCIQIVLLDPPDVPAFLDARKNDKTVAQWLAEEVSRVGENIVIRRFVRYELGGEATDVGP